ncbi:MAG: glycosyl transferase family 2 [Notoacmeibacter sp.]
MLTAFILANNDPKALTRTLNALIGAAVDGLVREVIVLAPIEDETAANLADHAGCGLFTPDQFANAVALAKGDWLLILQAGALPEQGWSESIGDHIQAKANAAKFKRSALAKRPLLARIFQAEHPLALGLLIEKAHAINLGKSALQSAQVLVRAAKTKTMQAALRPA